MYISHIMRRSKVVTENTCLTDQEVLFVLTMSSIEQIVFHFKKQELDKQF